MQISLIHPSNSEILKISQDHNLIKFDPQNIFITPSFNYIFILSSES